MSLGMQLSAAPPKLGDPTSDKIERHLEEEGFEADLDDYEACGCLPPLTVGYVVIFLQLLEAMLVLFSVTGLFTSKHGWFKGLDEQNPFFNVQWVLLGILSVGDILTAFLGASGLYLSENEAPPQFRLRSSQGDTCAYCVWGLFVWRVVVTLLAGPCVGVMLAFEAASFDRQPYMLLTLGYLGLNLAIIWAMMLVYRVAAKRGESMQLEINAGVLAERRQLVEDAYRAGPGPFMVMEEPAVFDCVRLDVAIGIYSFILIVVCLGWFTDGLVTKHTIGGWLFPVGSPYVSGTRVLELGVYLFSAVVYFVGLLGIVFFRQSQDAEAELLLDLAGQPSQYSDELEQVVKNKKRAIFAILMCFVAGVLRYALFIPITGMSIVFKDVCGFYVHGLAILSLKASATAMYPMHCTTDDAISMVVVLALASIDAYFMWCYFRLWRFYRVSIVFGPVGKMGKGLASYGSAHLGTMGNDDSYADPVKELIT